MFVCVKAWAYTRACAYTQARGARPQPLSHSAQWPESRLSSVLGVTSGGGAPGSGRAPRSGAQIGDSHGQSRVGDTDRHTRDRSTNPGAAPAPGPAAWAGPRAHGRAAARGRAHTTARTQPDTHARGAARHTTTPHSMTGYWPPLSSSRLWASSAALRWCGRRRAAAAAAAAAATHCCCCCCCCSAAAPLSDPASASRTTRDHS